MSFQKFFSDPKNLGKIATSMALGDGFEDMKYSLLSEGLDDGSKAPDSFLDMAGGEDPTSEVNPAENSAQQWDRHSHTLSKEMGEYLNPKGDLPAQGKHLHLYNSIFGNGSIRETNVAKAPTSNYRPALAHGSESQSPPIGSSGRASGGKMLLDLVQNVKKGLKDGNTGGGYSGGFGHADAPDPDETNANRNKDAEDYHMTGNERLEEQGFFDARAPHSSKDSTDWSSFAKPQSHMQALDEFNASLGKTDTSESDWLVH